MPQLEVTEQVPEGGQVRDSADLLARVNRADQREDQVEDVGIQEVALLPEQHGEHLVAGDLLHLCSGERVALENADKGLDSGVEALNVTCHGDQAKQHVATADCLNYLGIDVKYETCIVYCAPINLTFETGWGVNTLTPM